MAIGHNVKGNRMMQDMFQRKLFVVLAAFACCCPLAADKSASGQCLVNRLDAEGGDFFGAAVAMNDQYIVVGDPWRDYFDPNSGVAYVFRYENWNWVEEQMLLASDGGRNDQFGCSVAVADNVAVVGADGDDDNGDLAGSVYVFRQAGPEWMEQAKLLPAEVEAGDRFGASVAVSIGDSGQVLVVGAPRDDDVSEDAGAAFVYRWNGLQWVEETKLIAADGTENDRFGTSVAVEGDLIIVGALYATGDVEMCGSAYAYRYVDGAWHQEAKLTPADEEDSLRFGESLSLCGDNLVVGAPWSSYASTRAGAAFVFKYGSGIWKQTARLLPGDIESWDAFGQSVAISGDLVVVSAPWDHNEVGIDAGAVYVFQADGSNWIEIEKILPYEYESPESPFYFGYSMAMVGTTPLIGSPNEDERGAVYLMDVAGPDCNWNDYCDDLDTARGVSTDCDGNAIPDECEWYQTSRFLPSGLEAYDQAGLVVGISGPVAIVGVGGDDAVGEDAGSAYVYRYADVDWSEEARLTASDPEIDDWFGGAGAIDGDVIVVGAYGDDNGEDSGAAYVYEYDGLEWTEQPKLLPDDGEAGDLFGHPLGVSGDVIIAGARYDDDNGEDAGAAYIFRFDGEEWSEEAKLLASDGAADDKFAYSVDIHGDTAIVGAPFHGTDGEYAGAAYIFKYDGSA